MSHTGRIMGRCEHAVPPRRICIPCQKAKQKIARREKYLRRGDRERELNRVWIANNKDRHRELVAAWCAKNRTTQSRREAFRAWKGIKDAFLEQPLFLFQGGKCAVCETVLALAKKRSNDSFCLDHCHQSGYVRGLLCHGCNSGNRITDSPDLLRKKIAYLENPPAAQLRASLSWIPALC